MLEDLTSGTEKERQEFMASCVETLKKFKMTDLITPIFVFERLCNIIHPVSISIHLWSCDCHVIELLFQEENDVGQFFLSLEKDPQQEEFLQGRMQGNPYLSTTPGLGPLMRDVKNKICTGETSYVHISRYYGFFVVFFHKFYTSNAWSYSTIFTMGLS